MMRLRLSEVQSGDTLARGVVNPDKPREELLRRGTSWNDRLRDPFQRIGIRALWINGPGKLSAEELLDEDADLTGRNLAGSLQDALACIAAGRSDDLLAMALRENAIAFTEALEKRPHILCPVDELTDRAGNILHHSISVCRLSLLMALDLGDTLPSMHSDRKLLAGQRLLPLALGALLHDAGKLLLPENLCERRPWEMSSSELSTYRDHVCKGKRLLLPLFNETVAEIALCHHAAADGSGFPARGERDRPDTLHPYAGIVAAANAYEELVGHRNYLPIEALEEINCARRGQFDADALSALNRVVPPFRLGSTTTLATGHMGMITRFDPEAPFRPEVLLLQDSNGDPLPEKGQVRLNLADYPQARLRRSEGRPIAHLLPPETGMRWEEMR
jgi:HD-GYP domain-containing protein (c-di-GMP phosphodiesterase class II)